MKHNTSPEFAGIKGIKEAQNRQLALFEQWAAARDWQRFHDSHYDWWMFPIDRDSGGQSAKWTVYEGDIAELKQDQTFLDRYRHGVELLVASWGWDLDRADYLPDPAGDQQWQHWPVRLFKAAKSLRLFGLEPEFASLKKYALILMDSGERMSYGGHDLSWLFTTGIDPEG